MINQLKKILPDGLKNKIKKIVYKRRLGKIASTTMKKDDLRGPNKKVVYTCITGGYDDLISHKCKNLNWDYVCFTDDKNLINKKKLGIWNIRPLVFNELDNQRNSRWHKLFPSELFPEYDHSIYIDSSINILDNFLFERADELIKDGKIISQPIHSVRDCIYDEAKEVLRVNLDHRNVVLKQIGLIMKDGYPKHFGLKENAVMFRKHNDPLCIKIMKDWWWWLVNYSRRDQLSFNYVAWKNNFSSEPLSKDNKVLRCSNHFIFMSGKRKNRRIK